MKARWLTPLAMLPAGCAVHVPVTPSMEVTQLPHDSVEMVQQSLPAAAQAIAHWQLAPTDPWAPFAKFTLLASLGESETQGEMPAILESPLLRLAQTAATHLGELGPPDDVLFLVDLPGPEAVAFGVAFTEASPRPVSLVPTFQNWPYERELIPASETLAAMVDLRPNLPAQGQAQAGGTAPMFLLDAWRLAFTDENVPEGVTDNRYALSPADLPSADQLRARGIDHVAYVVHGRGGTEVEADDLHGRFLEYQAAGIEVSMVDLGDLVDLHVTEGWDWHQALDEAAYQVEPRDTVLTDPGFYARNPYGFGGFLAGQAVLGWGVGHFHFAHPWGHFHGGGG